MDHDRHLLRFLKQRGSDLRKAHALEFYVYFKTRAAARRARARIEKAGFHVELLCDTSGRRWVCLSIVEEVPSRRALLSLKRNLGRLARPLGGHCDGWGTQVEK